ncbi:MAG: hypothetical protein ACJ75J_14045 [Cytophagaceae bacterium]
MDRNYFMPVFKVEDRTELIVYSSVKFKQLKVGIPRCNQCFVLHSKSSFNSWIISLVTGTVLAISGFLLWGIFGIFSLIACFVFALVAPMFIADILVKRAGILPKKEGAMKDKLVQELVISGWSLNAPSAR